MSKYKGHTPGPWEVAATEFNNNEHGLPAGHVALSVYPQGEQDYPVCLVAPADNITDTDRANAKLIADAPRLAEKVKELEEAFASLYQIKSKLAERMEDIQADLIATENRLHKRTEQNEKMLAMLKEVIALGHSMSDKYCQCPDCKNAIKIKALIAEIEEAV
jgi:DNA repair ATPase RecN